LLVLGEAGIGKSRLVDAASEDARVGGVLVLVAGCLPLAAEMPLLPFGDVLRAAYEVDGGQWMTSALADCPRYAAESVTLLLPELREGGGPVVSPVGDSYPWWRQHLFASVQALFAALVRARPAALVLEDVHWADTSTLELLDYLLRPQHSVGLPAVLTFRTEDADTRKQNASWLARAKRSDLIDVLRVSALSRAETAKQIELLTGRVPDPVLADAVFGRSEGNPLFTEQLVEREAATPLGSKLPADLIELVDAKMGQLNANAVTAARVLAIAGRPLEYQTLMEVTGLSGDDVSHSLRVLKERLLLRSAEPDGRYALRHVLLGEAVAADLTPAERIDLNRRLATALAASGGPSPAAEIAAHWREAGSVEQELRWRVRAARDADAVYATEQASEQWLRAIELWDRAAQPEISVDLDVRALYAAAEDALEFAGHRDRACALAEAAFARFAAGAKAADQAELYYRLGYFQAATAVPRALEALNHAITLYEQLSPGPGLLRAYGAARELLLSQGRLDEAARLSDRALVACEGVDDPAGRALKLAERAWDDMAAGALETATRRMQQAWSAARGQEDPRVNVYLAAYHTDMLLKTCASSAEVERAAAPGLQAMTDFRLDEDHNAAELRFSVAKARIACGHVDRAAELLEPLANAPPVRDTSAISLGLAELAMLRGDFQSAGRQLTQLEQTTFTSIDFRAEIGIVHAELDLWRDDPRAAYHRIVELLNAASATGQSKFMGRSLIIAARAAADINELKTGTPTGTESGIGDESLASLRAAMTNDPLTARNVPADAAAHLASWLAELARSRADSPIAAYETAAAEWDRLSRPHLAAYCRWRQAQALLADRTTARADVAAVLRLAGRQARQHAPLAAAIDALARRARLDLHDRTTPTTSAPAAAPPFGLTERELAVLRLVAEGQTNSQIGATLFITRKTASVHVSNILRKLNVTTRVQAATVAQRAGLLAIETAQPGTR
jgi:DNA-binding CsgD family transcriptional regulator